MNEDGSDEIEEIEKVIREFDSLETQSFGVEMMRDGLIRRRNKLILARDLKVYDQDAE